MLEIILLLLVMLNEANTKMKPDEAKKNFRKIFVQKYLQHRRQENVTGKFGNILKSKINLNNMVKNLTNSRIINEITEQLTQTVLSRLTQQQNLINNKEIKSETEDSVERIEVVLDEDVESTGRDSRINGKIYK